MHSPVTDRDALAFDLKIELFYGLKTSTFDYWKCLTCLKRVIFLRTPKADIQLEEDLAIFMMKLWNRSERMQCKEVSRHIERGKPFLPSRERAWETGKGKNQRSGPSTVIFPLRVNLKEGISNISKCGGSKDHRGWSPASLGIAQKMQSLQSSIHLKCQEHLHSNK